MHTTLRQQLLELIVGIVADARPLVEAVRRKDRDLASQFQRALNSVALNVAEGFGSQAGNARLRFETARGSLYEAGAALELAAAWGYVSKRQAGSVVDALESYGGRLYGLSRR
jgi:four helix bundle protein